MMGPFAAIYGAVQHRHRREVSARHTNSDARVPTGLPDGGQGRGAPSRCAPRWCYSAKCYTRLVNSPKRPGCWRKAMPLDRRWHGGLHGGTICDGRSPQGRRGRPRLGRGSPLRRDDGRRESAASTSCRAHHQRTCSAGDTIASAEADRLDHARTRAPASYNGIATVTAELDEDSGVRLLSASDSPGRTRGGAASSGQFGGRNRRRQAALGRPARAVAFSRNTHCRRAEATEAEAEARPVVAKVLARCTASACWSMPGWRSV